MKKADSEEPATSKLQLYRKFLRQYSKIKRGDLGDATQEAFNRYRAVLKNYGRRMMKKSFLSGGAEEKRSGYIRATRARGLAALRVGKRSHEEVPETARGN